MVLAQMCTPLGGIECDVTVTRLAADRFYVVSAAATERHDYAWIERHLPDDGSVRLENLTSSLSVLTLAGPRSRDLLQSLTDSDCSPKAFKFFSARQMHVGTVPVRALRLSFVGELGYELHHPIAYTRNLYDQLMQAGESLEIVDFGYRALDSMRLEKGYRLWGSDMSADWTPLQAGMDRFVNFDKGDFIGRDALLRQRDEGIGRGLACLVVEADDADAHGYEPVYSRGASPRVSGSASGGGAGGKVIGYVASGGYGHTVGRSIAFSYIPVEYTEPGTNLEVGILGSRRSARVVEAPLYDPKNQRLLS
jgi:dimethylglycine dehydrogenase